MDKAMKTPYPLSTDYPLLFDLIQDGSMIFGMMKYLNQDIPAMIFKKDGYWIGSEFGTFENEKSTREQFAAMCESVNLKWIKP